MKGVLKSGGAKTTWEFGKRMGQAAQGGEVIGLIGPLGSGKTVFVQGLASGLNIKSAVGSPTFVIMNCYEEGRLPLCHVDLYRMDAPLETIGLEEYLAWDGVTAIEWANKEKSEIFHCIVDFAYAFDLDGATERILTVTARDTHKNLIDGIIA